MAISRSSSTISKMAQSAKSGDSDRGGLGGNILGLRRNLRIVEKSQPSETHDASQSSEASKLVTLLDHDASTSTYPPPSQKTQPNPPKGASQDTPLQADTDSPIFKARDFAYEPRPKIPPLTVDEKWVVNLNLPKNPVPGLRERNAEKWETEHQHLYRFQGNRADPPGKYPKTWGGRSKSEDEELTRQAEQNALALERMRYSAAALGFTPTEPNLGGLPPPTVSQVYYDQELALRAEEYIKQREAEAIASGHPLVKTPTNSPPPERRRRGFPSPPPPPPDATAPRPHESPERSPFKRKLREPDSERGNCQAEREVAAQGRKRRQRRRSVSPTAQSDSSPGSESDDSRAEQEVAERGRKRRQRQLGVGTTAESSNPPLSHYTLRPRPGHPGGATRSGTPSPKPSKRKGKGRK